MRKQTKNEVMYTLDLATLEGDGAFPCPKCGTSISPEDESEDNYLIIDTKVVNDELTELVISCGKCGSVIKLTGFQKILEG
jgi:transcription initiation factor IIE alpha subunit